MTGFRIIRGLPHNNLLIYKTERHVKGRFSRKLKREWAEKLWEMAIHKGALTELEIRSIQFILKRYKWKRKAAAWLLDQLEAQQQTEAHIQRIGGARYYRPVLTRAQELTQGNRERVLSLNEAKSLWSLFGLRGELSLEECRTLAFLFEHYQWTQPAEAWLQAHVDAVHPHLTLLSQIPALLHEEYGLDGLKVELSLHELRRQETSYENKVAFLEALQKGLDQIFKTYQPGCLSYQIGEAFEILRQKEDGKDKLWEQTRIILNESKLVLLPDLKSMKKSKRPYRRAGHDESIQENWMFGVDVNDVNDFFYYLIVRRDGQAEPYHYCMT